MILPVEQFNALGDLVYTYNVDISILVYLGGLIVFIMAIKLIRS